MDTINNSHATEGFPQPTAQNSPSIEGCPQPSALNSPPLEGCPKGGVVINNIPLKLNPILDLPYNPILKRRAKELRQAENLSEVLFWMQVTKGRFHKIDFDRQRVIGNYIVDFYVKKLGLVVEIDGSSHIGKEKYDQEREDYLISLKLRVYRIQVVDVMQHLSKVMRALEEYLIKEYGERPPRPAATPPVEGNFEQWIAGSLSK
jgi:very-short-patch-repair endonuclease